MFLPTALKILKPFSVSYSPTCLSPGTAACRPEADFWHCADEKSTFFFLWSGTVAALNVTVFPPLLSLTVSMPPLPTLLYL